MPISQPSQAQCDNMKPGDTIIVSSRSILYKLYRKLFKKDLLKINAVSNWKYPHLKNSFYQEDCTLVYAWEMKCVQQYKDEVPYIYDSLFKRKQYNFKKILIGLDNIQFVLHDGDSITFPTSYIANAIDKNRLIVKNNFKQQQIEELLKFQKYKGDTFKKIVAKRNIDKWSAMYCSACGKSVDFEFNDDDIKVHNNCICKGLKLGYDSITYDEFAVWYTTQTNSSIQKYYKQFWFDER